MGIENSRLEMLFLSPKERCKGIGKQLIQYGIKNYGIQEVTVNEQNPLIYQNSNSMCSYSCNILYRHCRASFMYWYIKSKYNNILNSCFSGFIYYIGLCIQVQKN